MQSFIGNNVEGCTDRLLFMFLPYQIICTRDKQKRNGKVVCHHQVVLGKSRLSGEKLTHHGKEEIGTIIYDTWYNAKPVLPVNASTVFSARAIGFQVYAAVAAIFAAAFIDSEDGRNLLRLVFGVLHSISTCEIVTR